MHKKDLHAGDETASSMNGPQGNSEARVDILNAQAGAEAQQPTIDDLTLVVKSLQNKLAEADRHQKEVQLRSLAEQSNLQKRAQQQLEQARKFALERFLKGLLPVLDSLDNALSNLETARAHEGLQTGVNMTRTLLIDLMRSEGVEIIDMLGVSFDPMRHHAMKLQETTELEPNHVMSMPQKGYLLNGRLLRPALVEVSQAPETSSA